MEETNNPLVSVVDIQFRPGQKVYFFDPADIPCVQGDHVIIDTARGAEYGVCASGIHRIPEKDVVAPLRKVLRLATAQDEKIVAENRAKEARAESVCAQKIQDHGLDMQLVCAECAFDGSKILFYFTADERVDFRDLVKDLAGIFHTRIELRQIGVRDEAKMIGGLGICGRPFCCSQFLDSFMPVSIKMAKTQNLSLNPTKISGTCGRLMCCLKYEQNAYEDAVKRMPKAESFVQTPDGPGNVKSVDLLRETVKVSLDSAPEPLKCYHNCEICVLRNGKGSREGIEIPERPARYVDEHEDEAFEMTPVLSTPFYMDPKLEEAPVREKMSEESGDGKPRRRHRGGRRGRGKSGAAKSGEQQPAEQEKQEKPRPPKQQPRQPQQPKTEKKEPAEGGDGGEAKRRRRPHHRGGRRRNKGGEGGSAPKAE